MSEGSMYNGSPLTSPERMGPLLESIIVLKWLEAIHPGLPAYIMEHRGDLFTQQTPNFCDIQPQLAENLDKLMTTFQETIQVLNVTLLFLIT